MSEKIFIPEPNPDLEPKEFWNQTVGAVDKYIPKEYVAEVQAVLQQEGHHFPNEKITNVRLGRNRNRVICKAIRTVGMKYIPQNPDQTV